SQGPSPSSPPPRQGAQLHPAPRWSAAPGTTVPPPARSHLPASVFLPRARGRLSAQGPAAELRVPETPAPRRPHRPAPAVLAPRLHHSVSLWGGTLPSQRFSGDPRPSSGCCPPPPQGPQLIARSHSAHWPAAGPGLRTCALGRSPSPSPSFTAHSRARTGRLPLSIPGHLAEPALTASSSFHL
ncbi:extensin-like, partial [Choloepus didactylus]|uniref:extensin-like n=1 Tax=Choloepus didactylus TaxID=27675 RepID=UPI00189CFFA1